MSASRIGTVCRRSTAAALLALTIALPQSACGEDCGPNGCRRDVSGGPYCGLYCVYSVLKLYGCDVEFDELLEQKYVGSYKGSSAEQLQRAAADYGIHAQPATGLTAASLYQSPHPVILHVRRPGVRMPFAHWVLYLGVEDGKARIVDPPNSVELITFAELQSLWDGTGVVMARTPEPLWSLRAAAWGDFVRLIVIVAATLGVIRLVSWRLRWSRHRMIGAGGLLVIALGVGLANHSVRDDGLLHNRAATGQVVVQHFQPELPEFEYLDLKPLVGARDVVIIDARFPADYEYGHIPGAVNLPIYAGLVERREILDPIPRSTRIVVYCQSKSCTWADSLATDVAFRGYDDVSLFPGGWREWQDHEQSKR